MVREAVYSDLHGLLALYLHLHETDVPEDSETLRSTWSRIMRDGNHHVIVDETDGKLVASCVCVIIPNLTRNACPYAFIENVVTQADYRRQGRARMCLDYARAIASQAGCYKIMLMTSAKTAGTLEFYRNCGFNDADKTAFIQWL